MEPLIAFLRPLKNLPQPIWHRRRAGVRRFPKTRRSLHLAIPMLRPNPIGLAQTRRPGKHRLAEFHADGVT